MTRTDPLYKERSDLRTLTSLDQLIAHADHAFRTVAGVHHSQRPYPAEGVKESLANKTDRRHVAGLMRVNHSGEVAAQALYAGQALTAREDATRESMLRGAQEETDHLAWCSRRLEELAGHKSLLNPLWYAGSFAMGAIAGVAGDRTSLGFVAETEKQVVEHLSSHLNQLPAGDARTRSIVEQMCVDEANHGLTAEAAGGIPLAAPIRMLMRLVARVMTRTAYWI